MRFRRPVSLLPLPTCSCDLSQVPSPFPDLSENGTVSSCAFGAAQGDCPLPQGAAPLCPKATGLNTWGFQGPHQCQMQLPLGCREQWENPMASNILRGPWFSMSPPPGCWFSLVPWDGAEAAGRGLHLGKLRHGQGSAFCGPAHGGFPKLPLCTGSMWQQLTRTSACAGLLSHWGGTGENSRPAEGKNGSNPAGGEPRSPLRRGNSPTLLGPGMFQQGKAAHSLSALAWNVSVGGKLSSPHQGPFVPLQPPLETRPATPGEGRVSPTCLWPPEAAFPLAGARGLWRKTGRFSEPRC